MATSRLLDATGQPTGHCPPSPATTLQLTRMYRMMMLCRLFDAKAINLQRTGRLGTYAPCTGHEATHVGVGAAMRPEDVLCPRLSRVRHAALARRHARPRSSPTGPATRPAPTSQGPREDFPWCVPIGSQVPHAAGVAMAFKIRQQAALRRRLHRRRRHVAGRVPRSREPGGRADAAGDIRGRQQWLGHLRAGRRADRLRRPSRRRALAMACRACRSTATTSSACAP